MVVGVRGGQTRSKILDRATHLTASRVHQAGDVISIRQIGNQRGEFLEGIQQGGAKAPFFGQFGEPGKIRMVKSQQQDIQDMRVFRFGDMTRVFLKYGWKAIHRPNDSACSFGRIAQVLSVVADP